MKRRLVTGVGRARRWRWAALEVAGIACIALALALVHVSLALGAVGLYALGTALLRQLVDEEQRDQGGR